LTSRRRGALPGIDGGGVVADLSHCGNFQTKRRSSSRKTFVSCSKLRPASEIRQPLGMAN